MMTLKVTLLWTCFVCIRNLNIFSKVKNKSSYYSPTYQHSNINDDGSDKIFPSMKNSKDIDGNNKNILLVNDVDAELLHVKNRIKNIENEVDNIYQEINLCKVSLAMNLDLSERNKLEEKKNY